MVEIFNELIGIIKEYNPDAVTMVTKAYELANELHSAGPPRESGEPYIIHPLSVAIFAAKDRADCDTICACLLHDVIEDCNISKDDIARMFNVDVANLVDGVTKISKLNFTSRNEEIFANNRKILTSIITDVRIIMIKLYDRLHNMQTLQFKKPEKQKENSLETLEIFVPLAYYIGAYDLKSQLEDLSFMYLKPDKYKNLSEKVYKIQQGNEMDLIYMSNNISSILNGEGIPNEIKWRVKNVYGIYKRLQKNQKLSDIHDLHALKIIVDDIKNCYLTLGIVHSQYPPLNGRFKDYIMQPKTNLYQSLHTTVFGKNENVVQAQIRTNIMDEVASSGLIAYWNIHGEKARKMMQESLSEKFQFFKSLKELNSMTRDNEEFILQVKNELFGTNVYVYTTKGDLITLPIGSTPVDFAYRIHTDIGNTMIAAIVNDQSVGFDYELKTKDIVRIITDDLAFGPRLDLSKYARTTHAKKKILEIGK